jgi:hypothetical protein
MSNGVYMALLMGRPQTGNFSPLIPCEQVLDFDHATGYLGFVAVALYPKDLTQQKQWLDHCCHSLKHDHGAATQLYQQMLELSCPKNTQKLFKIT